MSLVEKLFEHNGGKCDACGLRLGRKKPAILNLLDEVPGLRKKFGSSLIVCNEGVNYLNQYSVRDQVLFISGRYGEFCCPKMLATKNVGPRNNDSRGKLEVNSSDKTYQVCRKKPRNPEIVKRAETMIPEPLNGGLSGRQAPELTALAQSREYHCSAVEDYSPKEPDGSFSTSRLESALKLRRLTTTQILQVLDQSEHLGIGFDLSNRLKQEYCRLIEEMRNKDGYFVDKSGVVVPVKIPPKPTHIFLGNPPNEATNDMRSEPPPPPPPKPTAGYCRCKHCNSLMFYLDVNRDDCRYCGRNPVN